MAATVPAPPGPGGSEPEPPRRGRLAGRLVTGVLWSPLSVAVDHTWTVVTVAGTASGRSHTAVVRYAVGPRHVWVWPGDREHTTWWRGLRAPGRVTLRRGGRTVTGLARVVDGAVEPGEAARGLAVYAQRFPRTARGIVGGDITSARLLQAAASTVWVRIDVDDTTLRVDHDPAAALARGLRRARWRLGTWPAPTAVASGPVISDRAPAARGWTEPTPGSVRDQGQASKLAARRRARARGSVTRPNSRALMVPS